MNLLIFGVIPVAAVAVLFIVKRRFLWSAPLISAALALIAYLIALAPISITEVFSNTEWRSFLLLALLIQLGITAALTAAAYLVPYVIRQKQK